MRRAPRALTGTSAVGDGHAMARDAGFDLAKELGKPSFTPGARDAEALVALVVGGDEPAASRATAALARLGAAGRRAIAAAGAGIEDGAKARLIAALGLLARAGDDDARGDVIAAVADPAVRVRKAAVIALGKIGGDDARHALIARWEAGDVAPEERRALAEALGKIGGDDAIAKLKALEAGADAELERRRDRAVLIAERTARRGEVSRIRDDVEVQATVRLGCRAGIGALLGEELAALGYAPRCDDDRAEVALRGPLSALFAARLWATLALPFRLVGGADLVERVARTLMSEAVVTLLRACTEGPIRWRLGFARGHRRAVLWRVAQRVTAERPELINDPTATTWDAIVDDDAGELVLQPRRIDDPRFAYRVAEVPAGSHPTVAAALVWVAEARDADRVWDPFCGAGVELVERARRGPVARLVGSDVDPAALEAARANLAAAGVTGELVVGDARTVAPGIVDAIVTNPPLGSRVQLDAGALLCAALPGFARALAGGGRLVWITPTPRRTTPVAEGLGLVCRRRLAVDLGGVRGQLERWERGR